MNEKTKKCIEEMRRFIMTLHRSAADLDNILDGIENTCDSMSSEYALMYALTQRVYREDLKKVKYGDLEKHEDNIWNRLIESLKQ